MICNIKNRRIEIFSTFKQIRLERDQMGSSDLTCEALKSIEYSIQSVYNPPTIDGVIARELKPIVDGRGELTELWSKPWLADGLVEFVHMYQTATDFGVVKGWHLHKAHTDQLIVTRGKLQLCLVDIRPASPTLGHVNILFLGSQKPRLVLVPPMILHGWKALSLPEVLVVNLQSHLYDPTDEYKFPWNCVLENIWEPKNG